MILLFTYFTLVTFPVAFILLAAFCKLFKSRFLALTVTIISIMAMFSGYMIWSQEQNTPPDFDGVFTMFFMLGNMFLFFECIFAAIVLDKIFEMRKKCANQKEIGS